MCSRLATAFFSVARASIDCPQNLPRLTHADPDFPLTKGWCIRNRCLLRSEFHPVSQVCTHPSPGSRIGASVANDRRSLSRPLAYGEPIAVWCALGPRTGLGGRQRCQASDVAVVACRAAAGGSISRPTPRVDGEASTTALENTLAAELYPPPPTQAKGPSSAQGCRCAHHRNSRPLVPNLLLDAQTPSVTTACRALAPPSPRGIALDFDLVQRSPSGFLAAGLSPFPPAGDSRTPSSSWKAKIPRPT